MSAMQADGTLILKLYELRRDPEFRAARRWFLERFHPVGAEDIVRVMVGGFDGSAPFRMVTTYWEMAAALVNRGAIDEALFQEANSEHVAVFAKLHPHLAEVRAAFREPGYLAQLERLVVRLPDAEGLMARRRRLFERWRDQAATTAE
ncbi:MAG TPA: hypothetical protein VJ623_14945 [Holophagaceae bacterium]|nr:hypothetical protein [Holophagaceae bacterium]